MQVKAEESPAKEGANADTVAAERLLKIKEVCVCVCAFVCVTCMYIRVYVYVYAFILCKGLYIRVCKHAVCTSYIIYMLYMSDRD